MLWAKKPAAPFIFLLLAAVVLRTSNAQADKFWAANAAAATGRSSASLAAAAQSWWTSSIGGGVALPMSAATVAVPGSQNAPYRAQPPGGNTDALSHGLDYGPLVATTANDIRAYGPVHHAAFLLENGCIAATDVEPSPSQPAFCVPAGLGSRFVSVVTLPVVGAVGGVTDAGFMVFTGTMTAMAGPSTKCGYVAGPWTPQVSGVLLEVSRTAGAPLFNARWSGTASAFLAAEGARWTLCGLTRAGDLECMRAVAPWWSQTPPGGWKDFTTTGLAATTPADSACVDMTRNPLFWAPSPIFCLSSLTAAAAAGTAASLPPTCVSSHGPFVNFAVSTCSCVNNCAGTNFELGSLLTATRAADGVTIAYHAGWDGFDMAPVTAQARSIWNASAALSSVGASTASDPTFPVFRACAHANWPLAGRLANGSYFLAPALQDISTSRRNFVPQANLDWAAWSAATNVRPRAFGFSVRPADSNKMCQGSNGQELQALTQDGATLPQWSAYSPITIATSQSCILRRGQFSALVRHDGTLHSGELMVMVRSYRVAAAAAVAATASARSVLSTRLSWLDGHRSLQVVLTPASLVRPPPLRLSSPRLSPPLPAGHIDINFHSDKPDITYTTVTASVRSDAICFAFTSPLPSPAVPNVSIGSFRSQMRCIGSQTLDLIRASRSMQVFNNDGASNFR